MIRSARPGRHDECVEPQILVKNIHVKLWGFEGLFGQGMNSRLNLFLHLCVEKFGRAGLCDTNAQIQGRANLVGRRERRSSGRCVPCVTVRVI